MVSQKEAELQRKATQRLERLSIAGIPIVHQNHSNQSHYNQMTEENKEVRDMKTHQHNTYNQTPSVSIWSNRISSWHPRENSHANECRTPPLEPLRPNNCSVSGNKADLTSWLFRLRANKSTNEMKPFYDKIATPGEYPFPAPVASVTSRASITSQASTTIRKSLRSMSFFGAKPRSSIIHQFDINDLNKLKEFLRSSNAPLSVMTDSMHSLYSRSTHARANDFGHVDRISNADFLSGKMSDMGNFSYYQDSGKGTIMDSVRETMAQSNAMLIDAVQVSNLLENEKIKFVFDLFDVEKKNFISKEGVISFLDAFIARKEVQFFGAFDFQEIVEKAFAKTKSKKSMSYVEFERLFGQFIIKNNETKDDNDDDQTIKKQLLLGTMEPLPSFPRRKNFKNKIIKFYQKYQSEIICLTLYFALMVGAFVYKFLLFKNDSAVGPWARIAKGFAQIIMVNTSFVLFPMCRNFVTAIRQLPLIVRYIPIDQHIEFHKICGVVMLVASVGHTLGWIMIVYYAKTCSKNDWKHSRFSPRLTFVREKPLMELIPRIPIATGIAMLLIALIAAPMTSTKIRRGNFNAFWLTHLLFLPFLLLIVVHGLEKWVATPQAYMYILFPCLVYFMEKRYRVSNVFGGQSKIVSIQLYAETVALYIKKPRSFGNRLKPGMYLFLNVPVLSRFEWHPFTISSAPDDELLSLHIQRAGDWTNALHHLLCTLKSNARLALSSDGDIEQGATLPYPSISIDGPFGSPTYDYQRYRVLVLVAGGVGVTPFASILRSIVYTWESFRCGKCNRVQLPRTSFQITKIYFYWITRNQEQLTWFSSTINQLSEMDVDCRIEFHHYFSSLKRNSLVAPIKFLQTFIHDTDGQDIISGLHTKNLTHFGRPDWKNEIERIGKNHPEEEEIGVFICGSKKMSDSIDEECTNFNQRKLKTQYDFHAEIF